MKLPEKSTFEAYASKRVSFIITAKNRAEYLQKTLELHRELIKPDDELIIIDGCSTDHTSEVVNQYADQVDIFISEPDLSPGHALSKGMLVSRGKYIKQLPDDDVIYPAAMEQAIQVLEEHPEVDLLVCGGTRQRGDKITTVWLPPGTNYGSAMEDVFTYGACGIGFVIRRSALPLIGLYPLGIADDREFAIHAIENGANVKFCRINLFHHVIHEHSCVIKEAPAHKSHNYSLIRQHCSKRFYYQYRLDGLLRKYALCRLLLLMMRPSYLVAFLRREGISEALRRIVMILFRSKNGPDSSVKVKEYIWDGGFS